MSAMHHQQVWTSRRAFRIFEFIEIGKEAIIVAAGVVRKMIGMLCSGMGHRSGKSGRREEAQTGIWMTARGTERTDDQL